MGIESDFNHFARDSREFQGKVLASLDNMHQYISAVNGNTKDLDKKLDAHLIDNKAHGLDVLEKASSHVFQWIGIVISVVALIAAVVFKVHAGG